MVINNYGDGSGYGDGDGSGYGYGYGDGSGYGDGYGSGYGDGSGDGSGYGYGDMQLRHYYWSLVAEKLDAAWVLAERNAELKREMIEAMGPDRFFQQLGGEIVQRDVDGCGNPRALVRFPMPETEAGYLQAVRVVCPTTGRVYYLGVAPSVKGCQEAVAASFGMVADEYHPDRES